MRYSEPAKRLIEAAENRVATTALTDSDPNLNVASAYDIQAEVVQARLDRGHVVVGAKLGLTSVAKQKQMNVSEPLYGWLTSDMQIDTEASLRCNDFIQPRCEPEIAFLLGSDLSGAHISAVHVLAATQYIFAAVDVLDSRFAGYSFTLPDVAADNSSSAGFSLGGTAINPEGLNLRTLGCAFEKNGQLIATASGAAVLGHPAASVAWLVRKLATRGEGLKAGHIILSGAITEAVAVEPGDCITARFDQLGTVEIPCI
jgi:2-oxo-3-hexenedioate decarboxylase